MTYNLLDAKVFWELIDPTRIFLILFFKSIFLMGVFFKFAEGWSGLLKRATTHAHCRGIIVLLRGSAEWFLEVRDSVATVINCVVLIIIRQFLIRNFLLIIFQKLLLVERLLGKAPFTFIILLVHLLNLVNLFDLVFVLRVFLVTIRLMLLLFIELLWAVIRDNGCCLVVHHLTVVVIYFVPILIE